MTLWLVRGGRFGQQENLALDNNLAIVGFYEVPDLGNTNSRDDIVAILEKAYPESKEARIRNQAAQLYALVHRMQTGDLVAMPLKSQPQIAIGRVTGPYKYQSVQGEPYHTREVEWIRTDIPRTRFGQDLLYSLGAYLTVCQIKRNNAAERVQAVLDGNPDPGLTPESTDDADDGEGRAPTNVEQLARDQILSHLEGNFKGHELARLVEAILKAEGYRTYLSPPGPDAGVDILAGQGSLGLDRPRLCVQVKSSESPSGVEVFRGLKGSMETFRADQGLLVSWGGFTRDVNDEGRRSFFSVRLWAADDLLEALFRNYHELPEDIRNDLPLKPIWALVIDE